MARFGVNVVPDEIGVEGTNEVQTITVTGGPTGGTFDVTFEGQTASAIAYDASAAAMETALEALSNITAGDLTVTRSGAGTAGDPYVWTVTFGGTLAGSDRTEMTGDGSALTGGTTPDVAFDTTTAGVARAAGTYLVENLVSFAIQLDPSADCAGNVTISASIDGGTTYVVYNTHSTVASTPAHYAYINRELCATHIKVDSTGLTAGTCGATLAYATEGG